MSSQMVSKRCNLVNRDGATEATLITGVAPELTARQLIGKVADDFGEMLYGMMSALDMMRTRLDQSRTDEVRALVDITASSLHGAAILSRKLTAMSRAKPSSSVPVDVNAMLASMTALLRSMVGFEIECEFRLGHDIPDTRCDPDYLETVLFSLALDARKAIVGRGKIAIETCYYPPHRNCLRSEKQAFLEVCVTDTGPIAPATPAGSGPGLGATGVPGYRASIAIAQDFVAKLRGRLLIDQHPDAGTSVTMRLPCHVEDGGACVRPVALDAANAAPLTFSPGFDRSRCTRDGDAEGHHRVSTIASQPVRSDGACVSGAIC